MICEYFLSMSCSYRVGYCPVNSLVCQIDSDLNSLPLCKPSSLTNSARIFLTCVGTPAVIRNNIILIIYSTITMFVFLYIDNTDPKIEATHTIYFYLEFVYFTIGNNFIENKWKIWATYRMIVYKIYQWSLHSLFDCFQCR